MTILTMAQNSNPPNKASTHKLCAPRLLGVSIESVSYPGMFLQMVPFRSPRPSAKRGHGNVTFTTPKSEAGIGPFETFLVDNTPSHTVRIRSAGADLFLRMDASEVGEEYQPNGCFGPRGTVNCQSKEYQGILEDFYFVDQGEGRKAIASVAFPGRYLSLYFEDENSKDGTPGMTNIQASCQYGVGETELFWVKVL